MLTGHATPKGTARYAARQRSVRGHFREQQGLLLSSVGIGTYLGNPDERTDKAYEESIVRAVQLGVNVIDTAANYRFQRSERSIGNALRRLTSDDFSREEFVICTKGGYLPFDGAPPRDVRGYIEEAFVKPGIAGFEDIVGGSHCMTPAYLQNQLDQSLRNMQLECVDVYYIHNPESQLSSVSESEFYDRLRAAFDLLEENRKRGRLAFYGVATWNGFRVPEQAAGYHSLSKMVALAREAGGDEHGFRFVQLPFNLAMTEAFTLPNQPVNGERLSLLQAAEKLNVTVIASASILQGRITRGLPPELAQMLGSAGSEARAAIQFVRSAPGITTALVGMSDIDHVKENLQLAHLPPVDAGEFMRLFEE